MKMKLSKILRIFGFRIVVAAIVFILLGLLCDHWFYKHMTEKWTLLEEHNRNFRKDYGNGREFSVMDIKALYGEPDTITTDCMTYTAFNFTESKTEFPIAEILLTASFQHIYRHFVYFYFDKKNIGRVPAWGLDYLSSFHSS